MLDAIEEFRKIHIHDMYVTLPDDTLGLLDCSMGGTVGAKTETPLRKVRIEDRCQDLADGLLNEAIDRDWDGGRELHTAAKTIWDPLPSRIPIIP